MKEEIVREFVKYLDNAYPDVVELRRTFLQFLEKHPDLEQTLKIEFGRWLDQHF
ncbi:MAG: hypothetical protein QW220_06625 [Candidatus Bathyarchaeia archaeon]